MQFRTEISPLPGLRGSISHSTPVWTIGSCFADNIGDRMLSEGFDIEVNPLGTLYNPLSMLNSVATLAEGRTYAPSDFFPTKGNSAATTSTRSTPVPRLRPRPSL